MGRGSSKARKGERDEAPNKTKKMENHKEGIVYMSKIGMIGAFGVCVVFNTPISKWINFSFINQTSIKHPRL
ncbi:transmembrane protein [Arabidopsis thaliana]|uniref:Transmembrane protein n=1 Tax=Arabidopsis thaliana TaxID=3702 RepID=A0A1P8BHW0_ARATH|nr:uncharacterized protein AT5G15537 [Arabidopsis thaliana]NP_001332725.1 uncharacterized protein AT5G15537 [Arabidopsis thaliana]ANM71176.1 transmembrane protein [Arabidopsis thaliana]ANM71177.1 transmembrane protein [Arabidopsis thaliana]|eukprot:NP_001332724.1 transmembrane protein [Arabidopsis thaliana]